LTAAIATLAGREQLVEQRRHGGGELRARARRTGELLKIRALARAELAGGLSQPRGYGMLIKLDRQERVFAGKKCGNRAVLVDGEIIHDRVHRERQG
jgi:hypothetical protein